MATETEERTSKESDGNKTAEQQKNSGHAGVKKALAVGALAAAAGTAAYAASKAMSSGGGGGEDGSSENGAGRAGRVPVDQVVSAIGSARWDVLTDLAMPFAENGARSAGSFVATEAPDIVSENLVPAFIEGFEQARGEKGSSSD